MAYSAAARNSALGGFNLVSWTPQNVMRPVLAGFKPAVYQTTNLARALAPSASGRTRKAIRSRFTSPMSANIDALRRGPAIYPIVSGSDAGERATRGWFVPPGGHPVKVIAHPGSPPHPFLDRAQQSFYALYGANVRARWR